MVAKEVSSVRAVEVVVEVAAVAVEAT